MYQGFWSNDLKDGIGRFVNEKEHFEGLYKDDKICEVGLYKFLKSSIIGENEEQNNEEIEEMAYFTIDPDLWQSLGFEFMILNKKQSNEITISRSLEEMGPSESIKIIHETGEIQHLTISGDSQVIKRTKIYPKKKF